MGKYCLSKYDPEQREPMGVYRDMDWTSYNDIGKNFHGCVFAKEAFFNEKGLHITDEDAEILDSIKENDVILSENIEPYIKTFVKRVFLVYFGGHRLGNVFGVRI